MREDVSEPPRQVAHFALLIFVGFLIAASVVLSGRAVTLASFNNVAPASAVSPTLLPDYGTEWSAIVRRTDWKQPIAKLLGRDGTGNPRRAGWVVREWSFLSLPMLAYRQSDLVVFTEDAYGYRLSGLTEAEIAAIAKAGETPWFPWWRYVWGWLGVAAVAGFTWAEFGWQSKRRAMLGLI